MNIDSFLASLSMYVWIGLAVVFGLVFAYKVYRLGYYGALVETLKMRWSIAIPLLIAISLNILSNAVIFIPPEKIGVVISILWAKGYRDNPMPSGLHLIVPLAEDVILYPIFWQTYTMSHNPAEGTILRNDTIVARTKDGQEVSIDCSVIFRIKPTSVIKVHIDWQNRYIYDLIRPKTRGLIRREVARYTVKEVNSDQRTDLEEKLDDIFFDILDQRGFELDELVIRNVGFSHEYALAVEQKQVAYEGQEQKAYEAEQVRRVAKGEADKITTLAQADATAVVVKAAAEKESLQLVSEGLAGHPSLLTYEYISKLSPNIKVMLVPNNAPLLLSIPNNLLENFPTVTTTVTATVPITR